MKAGHRKWMLLVAVVIAAAGAQAVEITKGPYLQEITTDGVTVCWEVDAESTGTLEYGPSEGEMRKVSTGEFEALHKVRISGLEAGTTYYYRVSEGEAASEMNQFRTLPAQGAFTFVAYGDTRSNPGSHTLVTEAIRERAPAFVLHTGDLVGYGYEDSLWGKEFFAPAKRLLANAAVFAVPGNHEEESPNYYKYFGASGGKPWYSFDCVNAHFTMLDSCLDLAPGSEQYEWLTKDLAATDKRWRFVAFHHPLYSSGAHLSEAGLRTAIEPVLQANNVDMVFVGHDHHYERTLPIGSAFGEVYPITHVVTGGGGAPTRAVAGDFFTARCLSELNYCVVTVDGESCEFSAYDVEGHKIDKLVIVKSGEGYANDYPGKTAPMELAQVEGMAQEALGWRELDLTVKVRKIDEEYEFTAPAWGDVTLDIRWEPAERRLAVEPEQMTVRIEAGKTAKAAFVIKVKEGDTNAPRAVVKGQTKIGEFDFAVTPFSVKRPI